MDLTKWLTNEVLEDHLKEPIKIKVENLSDKFDLNIEIRTAKKGEK